MSKQANTLEFDDVPSFQQKEWRIQRIGWIAWALVLLAGLLGLLGAGPLSSTSSSASDDSLTVRYDRFLHYHQSTILEITIHPPSRLEDKVRLFISQSILERLQISRIEPEPEGRELAADGVVYTFASESGITTAAIRIHAQYETFGKATGRIGLVGLQPATVTQFAYP
jgi:hypothetical protein